MKKLIIGLLLSVSISVAAQTGEKNFIDQHYIEVTGKSEMEIVPDLIYLNIILSDKDNKNKQSLDEIDKSMMNKLKEIGIDVSKDLFVKDFSSNFKNYWISKSDIILTKEYQLIVHDAKTLQKVYFEMQKLGISNINVYKLDHSKIEQFRKEVKVNAIKAAKEKAESLSSAINQSVGKAIYIQELDNVNIINPFASMVGGAANVRLRSASNDDSLNSFPEVEFEKIYLQSAILVRFELK